jgi:hypothetical protein
VNRKQRREGQQMQNEPQEQIDVTEKAEHPLVSQVLEPTGRGWHEFRMKGGPDSVWIETRMDIRDALAMALRMIGPDRRGEMVKKVLREIERGE